MLKIMQGHKFFTVFVLSAITIMITIAFVFWGIGPNDNQQVSFVAEIEDERITLQEYWKAYDAELTRHKDQNKSPEDIAKLNLEDSVLSSLIGRKVLLVAARNAGISASDKEIQETIMSMPYFQKDGVFNQQVYNRALKLNRLTPQSFESSLRNDIIISKMNNIIGESAELSADELKILDSMNAENKAQLLSAFRSAKSSQAVQVYIDSIKRQMDIKVNRDIIS